MTPDRPFSSADETQAGDASVYAGANTETPGVNQAVRGTPSAQLDDWLAIEPDGSVTAFSGKVELGTGVQTALAQIVAEELDVPLARVRMIMADTARTPNEGYTAGSKTIQTSGVALRNAAAEARHVLVEMAANQLSVPTEALEVHDGTVMVRADPAQQVTYAALMGGQRFQRQITGAAMLKRPGAYRIVGTNAPRLDLLAKFTGVPSFVHDLRLPGMLHGRVVRPPSPGAMLVSVDEASVRYARVVRHGNFVGVVAEREEHAIQAAKQLKVEWRETANLPPMDGLYDTLRNTPATDQVVAQSGDVDATLACATTQLHAAYYQPFQSHASIGPSSAVAAWQNDELTVWCSSQGVYPLRGALADLLEMPPERVRVIHVEGAGCYGHNGADDAAADAAVLALAVHGTVRVQWTREDEFVGEPKAPAMVMELWGGVDERGRIAAWNCEVWSPTHANRPRRALNLIAGQLIAGQPAPASGFFLGGDRNAPTNYVLPNSRVTLHWLDRVPLRSSSMRSLGSAANTFANESFMDELAAAAGIDPVEFRLRHLDDPRARDVLEAAARHAAWGTQLAADEGRGVAFARYENDEAYVATIAQVHVERESGAVRLQRVVVAHDCGLIINPDGLRNQIEGNIIQSASRALKEEVRFDHHNVISRDWESYPILTFSEIPEIEIILLDRPDQPAVGGGEPATITTAPAIANAIYAATGTRVRQVPFTAARIHAALQSSD